MILFVLIIAKKELIKILFVFLACRLKPVMWFWKLMELTFIATQLKRVSSTANLGLTSFLFAPLMISACTIFTLSNVFFISFYALIVVLRCLRLANDPVTLELKRGKFNEWFCGLASHKTCLSLPRKTNSKANYSITTRFGHGRVSSSITFVKKYLETL